jgi:hypothetical protein
MNIFELKYFSKSSKGISASDFENEAKNVKINIDFILSLSEIETFKLPLSENFAGKYALVTMSNNDKYYIKENIFKILNYKLKTNE